MKKKRFNKMDFFLLLIAVALIVFTIEMIGIFKETGMIPDTLVTCVFAALGGECGAMAWIKTTKERQRDRKEMLEDRAHDEAREDAKSKNTEDYHYGT